MYLDVCSQSTAEARRPLQRCPHPAPALALQLPMTPYTSATAGHSTARTSVASLHQSKNLPNFEEPTCTNHPERSSARSPRAAAVLSQPTAPATTAGTGQIPGASAASPGARETRGRQKAPAKPLWGNGWSPEGRGAVAGCVQSLGSPSSGPVAPTRPSAQTADHGAAPWHGGSSQGKAN